MIERTPEPELMDEAGQALAYAQADFAEPNSRFVASYVARFGEPTGRMLDLGCGPADIPLRFVRCSTGLSVDAVDGAPAMIALAEAARAREPQQHRGRLRLICSTLQQLELPHADYDALVSNSLLHHLTEPSFFWEAVRRLVRPAGRVLVMDLSRPQSEVQAQALVDQYAAAEPAVLRHDFYHSLLAAFTPAEVEAQLAASGLSALAVETVSDRHWMVSGRVPSG